MSRETVKKGEFYHLADYLRYSDKKELGLPKDAYREQANVRAVWTGEKRQPRKGEWFLSGADIEAYKATNNLTTAYHIARLVKVRVRMVIEEIP